MRLLRKFVASLLIIIMINGMVPGLWQASFAATGTVNVVYDTYVNGTLNIKWDLIPLRGATYITYHTPNPDNTAVLKNLTAIPSTDPNPNKAAIPGLKSDYIYDITVDVYSTDALDGLGHPTGTIIASDTLHFLPQVSLYSNYVDQQYVDDPAGGRESGVIPALKISWTIPKIFDGATNKFIDFNNTTAFKIVDSTMTNFSYTINITDSAQRSNVLVDFAAGAYKARVAGDADVNRISDVNLDNTTGQYYFYLLGIKDNTAHLADRNEVLNDTYTGSNPPQKVLPTKISSVVNERNYVLPDKDILPGTVYYLKIKPMDFDTGSNYLEKLALGPSGSPLVGLPYTFTPIRFQLTKNSLDNVNVKIYKVNQGDLKIPEMAYFLDLDSVNVKELSGANFTGEFAYTVVTGVGVNNTVFYKVTVKTHGTTDKKLESIKIPYVINFDTSKPPVPQNVAVAVTKLEAGNITVNINGTPTVRNVNSSDITISWDKPANWDKIRLSTYDSTKDVYFHFLFNTFQSESTTLPYPDLIADDVNYGSYPLQYRLVKYVSANSPNIIVNGNRLEYTINAFDLAGQGNLFNWENNMRTVNSIANTEKYPSCVLPNTVYYVRMYTTAEVDKGTVDSTPGSESKMSDKSLTTSFTTLSATQRDVPLPSNFQATTNLEGTPKANFIQLKFDTVKNIDWNNYTDKHDSNDALYYDIYMSSSLAPSKFIMIGSTQYPTSVPVSELDSNGVPTSTLYPVDIEFGLLNDPSSVYITAKIKKIRNGAIYSSVDGLQSYDPYAVFGDSLRPNSNYYFIIKSRMVLVNEPVKESISTAVLPVTTLRLDITTGDSSTKRHTAPIDFSIAKDANGNLKVSGQTVTFTWSKKETGVTYELISTTSRMSPDSAMPTTDPIYNSFLATFKNTSRSSLSIDPTSNNPINVPTYDPVTKMYSYTINKWLNPNKLYYFSLRVEDIMTNTTKMKESVWISIPVTTSLIEGPTSLEPVNDPELGFSWNDTTIDNVRIEDFRISVKGPKDTSYKILTRAQASFVLDTKTNHTTDYYIRIYNLLPNTHYDVLVQRPNYGANGIVSSYSDLKDFSGITGKKTKDDYHQIEIKWKGLPVDQYSGYEIAIKTIDGSNYTILQESDLEPHKDIAGNTYPYFIEKSALTVGTSYSIFHAKIDTVEVTLADGTKQHQPLKANTKYFIKIRAYKADAIFPQNPTAYSKYIGPVDTRTEFNQADYDKNDQDLKKTALFMDKIAKLEENLFWRVGISNNSIDKLFLKGDRVVNAMENSGDSPFMLDFSGLGAEVNIDVIYVPIHVAQTMNTEGKSLVIKTFGGEFTFKPNTIDVDNLTEINTVKGISGVIDMYLKLTITRIDYPKSSLPPLAKNISKVNDLGVQVVGSSKKDSDLKTLFHDKLYNTETGLIKQQTDRLLSSGQNVATQTPQQLNTYIDGLLTEVEADLSDFINATVEGAGTSPGMIVTSKDIQTFSNPLLLKLAYLKDSGRKAPYINYDTKATWQKLTSNIINIGGTLTFNVAGTGKYSILTFVSPTDNLAGDYWAKDSINKLSSKYDLSSIFTDINSSFNPEINVTGKESILLYELIMNKVNQDTGMDIKQKTKSLGLDNIINTLSIYKEVKKQQSAAVLIKVYAGKRGFNADMLKSQKNIFIKDESDIDKKFYNSCVLSLDMEFLTLDDNSNFMPGDSLTRAELISAFVKVLELTGDL